MLHAGASQLSDNAGTFFVATGTHWDRWNWSRDAFQLIIQSSAPPQGNQEAVSSIYTPQVLPRIILTMRVFLAGLVIASAVQAKITGKVKNDPNFQMNDLVDWSSLPGRSDLNPDDEDTGNFIEEKRNDPNFNINELVDWSSVKLPGMEATEQNEEISNADIPGEHLNPEDFIQADFVKESFNGFGADPIEAAGLFEGDIENVIFDDLKASKGRNAIRESWRKWPGASIPYVISSSFGTNERRVIAKAMKEYHEKTCIRFTPRTSEGAYIHIMKGNGCSSSIGRTGRKQSVSLGTGCVYAGRADACVSVGNAFY